jgi:hypothetical protein
MSLGISPSDFVSLPQFAWRIWRTCRDAPDDFKELRSEVASFYAILHTLEESKGTYETSPALQTQLNTIEQGCWELLRKIEKALSSFHSLDAARRQRRSWIRRQADSLRYGSYNISALRHQITAHTSSVAAFHAIVAA